MLTLVPDYLSLTPDHSKSIEISCVVPVYNSMPHLVACVRALQHASAIHGATELIFVDNGSNDGSYEFLVQGGFGRVLQDNTACVAALRNLGTRIARGKYFSFIDSDCVVELDYFKCLEVTFRERRCDCTGSMVSIPDSPHWIEATWNGLHRRRFSGNVQYLNSGNLAVSRAAFEKVGGFNEALETGEDAAFGLALNKAGFSIFENLSLRAIHLGNPKTLRQFVRKEIWRGQGALGTVEAGRVDKTFTLTLLHGAAVACSLAIVISSRNSKSWVLATCFVFAAPMIAYGYRAMKKGGLFRPLRATFLYWLYLNARLVALALLVRRKLLSYLR